MKKNRVKINGEYVNREYLANFLDLKPYDTNTGKELPGIYFVVGETRTEHHYVQVLNGSPVATFKREEICWK